MLVCAAFSVHSFEHALTADRYLVLCPGVLKCRDYTHVEYACSSCSTILFARRQKSFETCYSGSPSTPPLRSLTHYLYSGQWLWYCSSSTRFSLFLEHVLWTSLVYLRVPADSCPPPLNDRIYELFKPPSVPLPPPSSECSALQHVYYVKIRWASTHVSRSRHALHFRATVI